MTFGILISGFGGGMIGGNLADKEPDKRFLLAGAIIILIGSILHSLHI